MDRTEYDLMDHSDLHVLDFGEKSLFLRLKLVSLRVITKPN